MSSLGGNNLLSPNNPLYYAPRHLRDRAGDPHTSRGLIGVRQAGASRDGSGTSDGETEEEQLSAEFAETAIYLKKSRGPLSKLLVASVLIAASAGFAFWIVPDIIGVQAELSSAGSGGIPLAVIPAAAADVSATQVPEPARIVEKSPEERNGPIPVRVKVAAIAPEPASQTVGIVGSPTINREAIAKADAAANAPRKLAPAEVAALIKRGQELATDGDFPAARLLLQRAAEAHEPRAALALAATYDPIAIKRFTATGAAPDKTLADAWYQKAKDWESSGTSKQGNGIASIAGR